MVEVLARESAISMKLASAHQEPRAAHLWKPSAAANIYYRIAQPGSRRILVAIRSLAEDRLVELSWRSRVSPMRLKELTPAGITMSWSRPRARASDRPRRAADRRGSAAAHLPYAQSMPIDLSRGLASCRNVEPSSPIAAARIA
ncbi:MAG: hypothetical protein IPP18_00715 [Rhodocyclaceae bacterium]|nr:hypothetical protein [Rhodocyclaceae bacterium]